MGIYAPGLVNDGHDAVSLSVFCVWQEAQDQVQIC